MNNPKDSKSAESAKKFKDIKYFWMAIPAVIIVGAAAFFLFAGSDNAEGVAMKSLNGATGDLNAGGLNSAADSKLVAIEIDYTQVPDHIGEQAIVKGTIQKVFTAKSGVTFLDFCPSSNKCPFSAVIFKSDKENFPDLEKYKGPVKINGVIRSYKGQAEIILNSPEQIESLL